MDDERKKRDPKILLLILAVMLGLIIPAPKSKKEVNISPAVSSSVEYTDTLKILRKQLDEVSEVLKKLEGEASRIK